MKRWLWIGLILLISIFAFTSCTLPNFMVRSTPSNSTTPPVAAVSTPPASYTSPYTTTVPPASPLINLSPLAGSIAGLETLLEAGGSPVERYTRALAQTPFQARGGFTGLLDGLLTQLRARARRGGDTQAIVAAIARVLETRELAQGNVNPQLLTALLGEELQADRRGA